MKPVSHWNGAAAHLCLHVRALVLFRWLLSGVVTCATCRIAATRHSDVQETNCDTKTSTSFD